VADSGPSRFPTAHAVARHFFTSERTSQKKLLRHFFHRFGQWHGLLRESVETTEPPAMAAEPAVAEAMVGAMAMAEAEAEEAVEEAVEEADRRRQFLQLQFLQFLQGRS
jgi:uncharacterized damage-inducible protein DinB